MKTGGAKSCSGQAVHPGDHRADLVSSLKELKEDFQLVRETQGHITRQRARMNARTSLAVGPGVPDVFPSDAVPTMNLDMIPKPGSGMKRIPESSSLPESIPMQSQIFFSASSMPVVSMTDILIAVSSSRE